CRASLLARVPGVENRRQLCILPIDSERAAAEQDQDRRFAQRMDLSYQLLLWFWQSDVGAIPTAKPFRFDFHLLTFNKGCQTHHHDNNVSLFGFAYCVIAQLAIAARWRPNEPGGSVLIGVFLVFETDVVSV